VTLVIGFTFYIAVVNLPQRFQIVAGDGAVIAGIKLLPMMAASAIGSFAAGGLSRKRDLTSHVLVVGLAVQVLGYGLMSSVSKEHGTPAAIYGYQVFIGLGFGASIASATIMVPLRFGTNSDYVGISINSIGDDWHGLTHRVAATQGALTQMRSFGGSIGLAIGVIIFNTKIRSSVTQKEALQPQQIAALFKSPLAIESFSRPQQALVSGVYAEAFAQQMRVATYISALGLLLSLCTFEYNPFKMSAVLAEAVDSNGPSMLAAIEQGGKTTTQSSIDAERGEVKVVAVTKGTAV